MSAIGDAALAEAVRAAHIKLWQKKNAAAIAERLSWIERNGQPLTDLHVMRLNL
ncbi:MAG: type II toxin-antitoxin system CcdA family antitoxin [Opitutales bacterium]|nr:type II toxin-antitoxin system CcdA family antitoxin [Opitutales bacterium]